MEKFYRENIEGVAILSLKNLSMIEDKYPFITETKKVIEILLELRT